MILHLHGLKRDYIGRNASKRYRKAGYVTSVIEDGTKRHNVLLKAADLANCQLDTIIHITLNDDYCAKTRILKVNISPFDDSIMNITVKTTV